MRLRDRLPNYIKTVDITDLRQPPDYIISIDGSNIVALSGTNGSELIRNTDFSTVIQACISDLTATGGYIFIKNGAYTVTKSIVVEGHIVIAGAGPMNTTLTLGNNVNDDIFQDHRNFANNKLYFTLRDMQLDGNSANNASGSGVSLVTTGVGVYWDVGMWNVGIGDCKEHGFESNAGHGYLIEKCAIEDSTEKGIYLTGDSYATIFACTLKRNLVDGIDVVACPRSKVNCNEIESNGSGTGAGIRLGSRSMAFGNTLYNNNTVGISVSTSDYSSVFGNYFSKSTNQTTHIKLSNGGTYNRVYGNTFETYTTIYDDAGQWNTINGIGRETANAETPTAAQWTCGNIVQFIDSGDASGNGIYIKDYAGNWTKLA